MSIELDEMRARINAALDIMPAQLAEKRARARLEWEAREIISQLPPEKMTPAELTALIAVLHSAYARVLSPPTGGRPLLRIIPDFEEAPEIGEPAV